MQYDAHIRRGAADLHVHRASSSGTREPAGLAVRTRRVSHGIPQVGVVPQASDALESPVGSCVNRPGSAETPRGVRVIWYAQLATSSPRRRSEDLGCLPPLDRRPSRFCLDAAAEHRSGSTRRPSQLMACGTAAAVAVSSTGLPGRSARESADDQQLSSLELPRSSTIRVLKRIRPTSGTPERQPSSAKSPGWEEVEPPWGVEPQTYALRVPTTPRTRASTCTYRGAQLS
jgi:hypothetical protein